MAHTHQISLSAELESLPLFRDLVKTACQNMPEINEQIVYDIQLAVDEVCTNIITHGYEKMDPGSIIMEVEIEPHQVIVSITDFGHPFEPVEPPPPNLNNELDNLKSGGLGLFFVFMSVDDIEYQSSETGNITKLIKKY
ncbi:MAG: anti-sigma-factor antagonist [Chloroflexi bacterium OLB14]|nr:MAG: anti-sigma-factor antagonist [Chloroflexi bacterium OLB14]